ncbi:MAG: hypothetical protein MRY79_08805 [Alphaproteobacteria bacterium]|nr:hypothetical protein [Alphaproteobacteria bacterium]
MMSREYVETKIKEALKLTKGNATQARQQLIAWAMEDVKLLQGLVKPHMTGIVAHAFSRTMRGENEPEHIAVPADLAKNDKDGSFGMDILKTIANGDTAQFGMENAGRPVGKRGASDQHIDAIRRMVNKGNAGDS